MSIEEIAAEKQTTQDQQESSPRCTHGMSARIIRLLSDESNFGQFTSKRMNSNRQRTLLSVLAKHSSFFLLLTQTFYRLSVCKCEQSAECSMFMFTSMIHRNPNLFRRRCCLPFSDGKLNR